MLVWPAGLPGAEGLQDRMTAGRPQRQLVWKRAIALEGESCPSAYSIT